MITIVMYALGLVGAWCLYVGPVYQASLELRAQEMMRQRIVGIAKQLKEPSNISAWWWLLPPIRWYLERKRTLAFRERWVNALSIEDNEALHAYMHKAAGWLLVAGGGLLLAIKETHAFCMYCKLSMIVFVALSIFGAFVGVFWTIMRIRASETRLAERRRAAEATSGPT
jgi:hypothetical protein